MNALCCWLLACGAILISATVRAEDAPPVAGGATSISGAVTGEGGTSTGVKASTGAPSVGYPFELPPGRLTPSLGLHYALRGGTLEAGYGWGLSISSITRVKRLARSQAPRGSTPGVLPTQAPFPSSGDQLGADGPGDNFEIDGEPLIPLCRINSSGKCTESGVDSAQFPGWAAGGIFFRKQHDPEFKQYFWLGVGIGIEGERTWVERSKTGHVRIFGFPGGGAYAARGIDTSASHDDYIREDGTPVVVKWNLLAEYDANRFANGEPSNVIQYVWSRAPGSGSNPRAYLTQIVYDPPGAGASLSSWTHRVLLSWDRPADKAATDYAPLWAARPTARLTQVTMSSLVAPNQARETIRSYHLAYQTPIRLLEPQSRSLLESIQMQGRMTCLAA